MAYEFIRLYDVDAKNSMTVRVAAISAVAEASNGAFVWISGAGRAFCVAEPAGFIKASMGCDARLSADGA